MESKVKKMEKVYSQPKIYKMGNFVKMTKGTISNGNDSGASFHNTGGGNG